MADNELMERRVCEYCGSKKAYWIEQYHEYYCDVCGQYSREETEKKMEFINIRLDRGTYDRIKDIVSKNEYPFFFISDFGRLAMNRLLVEVITGKQPDPIVKEDGNFESMFIPSNLRGHVNIEDLQRFKKMCDDNRDEIEKMVVESRAEVMKMMEDQKKK